MRMLTTKLGSADLQTVCLNKCNVKLNNYGIRKKHLTSWCCNAFHVMKNYGPEVFHGNLHHSKNSLSSFDTEGRLQQFLIQTRLVQIFRYVDRSKKR